MKLSNTSSWLSLMFLRKAKMLERVVEAWILPPDVRWPTLVEGTFFPRTNMLKVRSSETPKENDRKGQDPDFSRAPKMTSVPQS